MEIDIGIGKSGRRAFGFDDIAIVPSRRTRDPDDVDISWEMDAFPFDLPMLGSAMDSAISPATAIEIGRLGGLGVLNLEGLWSRYEDPTPLFDEIAELPVEKATRRMQEIYAAPIDGELMGQRIHEMKAGGVVTAASLTPQNVATYAEVALRSGLDILVIQGNGRVGRACVLAGRAAQSDGFHSRFRHAGDCGRVRVVFGVRFTSCGPEPPAFLWALARAQPARHAAYSASGCLRQRPSPMPPAPAFATWTRRVVTCTSSRTVACAMVATCPRRSPVEPTQS